MEAFPCLHRLQCTSKAGRNMLRASVPVIVQRFRAVSCVLRVSAQNPNLSEVLLRAIKIGNRLIFYAQRVGAKKITGVIAAHRTAKVMANIFLCVPGSFWGTVWVHFFLSKPRDHCYWFPDGCCSPKDFDGVAEWLFVKTE